MKSKKKLKRYFDIWWKGIKSIPETTSIHGFRFIADSKRHWTERVFWLIFVTLSWYGSSLLIRAQYDAFQNNPISFVVETTYKDWDTHFPSVAICENDNSERIEEISDHKFLRSRETGGSVGRSVDYRFEAPIEKTICEYGGLPIYSKGFIRCMHETLWGENHDFNMEEVLKELAYFKGVTYYTTQFCSLEDPLENCLKDNLTYYANMVRSSCEATLANCSWNDEDFSCCDYFRPMDTEIGICYAINTLQGREMNPPKFPMVSNRTTGPGGIKFNVLVPGNVYVLNEEDVPSLTTPGSDVLNVGSETFVRRYITIRNIENDAGARLISPKKRKCHYTDENTLQVYNHYSYSACTVQCRKEAQLKYCNCTNFFMPNTPESLKCDIKGIICLNEHMNDISVLKARWSTRPGLFCDCFPSCTEAEISFVKDFKSTTDDPYTTVQIELSVLPSERYRRNVVRGILDLVVSTGGTGGLFLGASILSFVELIYILLLRPFCDIYSQKGAASDSWYKRFGTRKVEDNKFVANKHWSFRRTTNNGLTHRVVKKF